MHFRDNKIINNLLQNSSIEFFDIEKNNLNTFFSLIKRHKVTAIFNCISLTSIENCEQDPEKAKLINEEFPGLLAAHCHSSNIQLIHFSTDAVFSGDKFLPKESDSPNPKSIYGKTKLAGEKSVISYNSKACILRVNFYGDNNEGKSIFNYFLNGQKRNIEVNGFNDVFFNPLWVRSLAKIAIEILDLKIYGLYHVTGNTVLSKYDFGKIISDWTRKVPVQQVSIDEFGLGRVRSKNLTMDNKLIRSKGLVIPEFRQEINQLIKETYLDLN